MKRLCAVATKAVQVNDSGWKVDGLKRALFFSKITQGFICTVSAVLEPVAPCTDRHTLSWTPVNER